jgi:uncharacterized SAM-binding protein YcdF (DUF218 family)
MVTMEIFLSKFIPLFIYPMGFLSCLLFAAGALLIAGRPRAARIVVIAALVITVAAGNTWTSHTLIRSLESDYAAKPVEAIPEADVIIVLGGGLGLPYPPRLYPRLTTGSDRLLHALRLYRAGKADYILVTGGHVFPQPELESEAWYSRELLALWGVPESAILIETESRNTIQNAQFSAQILSEQGWNDALLVTSATHMHRSLLAFRNAGIEVTPVPTDFIAVEINAPEALYWVPTVGAMAGTTHALREYLGRLWYRIRL